MFDIRYDILRTYLILLTILGSLNDLILGMSGHTDVMLRGSKVTSSYVPH